MFTWDELSNRLKDSMPSITTVCCFQVQFFIERVIFGCRRRPIKMLIFFYEDTILKLLANAYGSVFFIKE